MSTDRGTVVEVSTDRLGDELATAVAAGATTLTVADAVDFQEDGGSLTIGTETLDYLSADDDTAVLTLASPLAGAYAEGEPVLLDPPAHEKYAQVMVGDSDEAVQATVPHTLWDRIADGVRGEGEGEVVDLELIDGEYVVAEIVGAEPVVDGSFLDPATVPDSPNLDQLQLDLAALDAELTAAEGDITQLNSDLAATNVELDAVLPITSTKLADDAVTSAKIAANAVNVSEIAAGAVAAGKIAASAVGSAELYPSLASSLSQIYYDDFADVSKWSRKQGSGSVTATAVTDSQTGGSVGRFTGGAGDRWARDDLRIPYDPNTLYRMRVRVRDGAANSAAARFYAGYTALNSAGQAIDTSGALGSTGLQHYQIASNADVPAGPGWTEYVGYIKGVEAAGVAASGTPSTDPKAPRKARNETRWVRPFLITNISGTATDVQDIDLFTIEVVPTGVVEAGQIVANAVTANEIAANAVTASELAAGAVTAGKVAAGAITANEIAAGAITTLKLAAGAVTANEIAAGAVQADKIAANAVTAGSIAAGAVTTLKLAAGAVTANEIGAGAVTTAKLSAGVVTANEIGAGAVTTLKLAAGAVTANEIAADAITADKIAAGAITASEIASGAITGDKLTATAIDGKTITGATFRTASTGERIELGGASGRDLRLHTAMASQTLAGQVEAYEGVSATGVVRVASPTLNNRARAEVYLRSESETGAVGTVLDLFATLINLQGPTAINGSTRINKLGFDAFFGTTGTNGRFDIAHGLGTTPTVVLIQPQRGGWGTSFVDARTSTTFGVQVRNDAGTNVGGGQSGTILWLAIAA